MPQWVYDRHLWQTLAAGIYDSSRYFEKRAEYQAVHDSGQWKVIYEKQKQKNRPRQNLKKYNKRRMSPASVSGGCHFRLSAVG